MIDPKYTKEVSSTITEENETTTSTVLSGNSLAFSLCNRTNVSNNLGNYFVSFNLPAVATKFPTGSTISLLHPELQQLNTNKIIVAQIPSSGYSEYIDGRSIELSIPIATTAGTTYYKIYSSTYSSDKALKYGESSPLIGDNVAFLFSDNINRPYSGLTVNEIGQFVSHSAITTWNPTSSYIDRPAAVSYLEVQGDYLSINSDRRYKLNLSTKVPAGHPAHVGVSADFPETDFFPTLGLYVLSGHGFRTGDTITIDKDDITINPSHDGVCTIIDILYNYAVPGYLPAGTYDVLVTDKSFAGSSFLESGAVFKGMGAYCNYDVPVGFVLLDKGMVVLTHKKIVDKLSWSAGTTATGTAYTDTGNDNDKKRIYFTGSNIYMNYVDLKSSFRTSVVCMALNGEFYNSNNPTWDRGQALATYAATQPVQITETGLYNSFGELIAVSKFSEPLQKAQDDIIVLNVQLNM